MERLGATLAPGPLSGQLRSALRKVEACAEQVWDLARSGSEVSEQAARTRDVAGQLAQVQAGMRATVPGAPSAEWLAGREATLAAELRELRRTEAVAANLAGGVSEMVVQLEALVTRAAELVAAGVIGPDLDEVSSRLQGLAEALREVPRSAPGQPSGMPTTA